ncbi:uncharacterized protein LOC127279602 [Leptopilina boulardi]|uniref:uncharacterized protein LOC127279602 n=1 Tax=Leptopilina boulardi TaxID=63433 RepID=UPI0021F57419|nr:uncharacterized protein LOC127279602 [Leptopilina boulardi]
MLWTFSQFLVLHLSFTATTAENFVNKVITELANLWDGVKLVHGKPRHSQSQGSVERANQDVQHILASLMEMKKTTKWSEELKYVQMMKNRSYHSGTQQTPYEALFGSKMKLGLKSSNFPNEVVEKLQSEEELENVFNEATLHADDEAIISSHSEETVAETNEPHDDNLDEVTNYIVTENGALQEVRDGDLQEISMEHGNEKDKLNSLKDTENFPVSNDSIASNKRRIRQKRALAHTGLQLQANKMLKLSIKKFPPAANGDSVKVPIPYVDRSRTDPKNVLATVLSIDDDMYVLGTKEGRLK